jgi:HPt (histidine-containing phosphotransfer) domain-containing protein
LYLLPLEDGREGEFLIERAATDQALQLGEVRMVNGRGQRQGAELSACGPFPIEILDSLSDRADPDDAHRGHHDAEGEEDGLEEEPAAGRWSRHVMSLKGTEPERSVSKEEYRNGSGDSAMQPSTGEPALVLKPEAIDSVLRVGGVPLLKKLVSVAEANIRHRLEQWTEALACSPADFAAAERAAHSIKSSAAYLGVEALRGVAAGMETSAREGRFGDLESQGRRARELLEAAMPVLEAEVRRHGG